VRRTKPCEQGFTRESVAPALVLHIFRFASLRLFRVDIPAHSQAPLRPGIASIPRASCGHGLPTRALASSPRHTLVRPVVSRCDSHHKTALSPVKTSPRNEDQHVRLAAASLTLEGITLRWVPDSGRTYYFSRAGPTRSARVPPPPRSIDHWRHARRLHAIIWQQQLDGGAKAAIAIHHYLKRKTVFASAPSTSSAGCRPCRALNARGIKAEDQPHAKQGALQTRDVPISPRLLWTDAKLLLAAINELNRQGWLGRDGGPCF
jgi:hypothetical protein